MAIKTTVGSLDDVPEALREHYIPKGGKYVLALDGPTAQEAELGAQVQRFAVDDRLRTAAAGAGIQPRALEDVLNRGREMFRVEGGNVVARKGDKPVFGPNGRPLSIDEWARTLASDAPHLFEGAPSTAAAPEAPKSTPGSVVRGPVKRRDFDGLDPKAKRLVVDAVRAGQAALVD